MGHLAIAAFNHEKTEDRLMMFWKWLDQSAPNKEKNPNKSSYNERWHVPIRFASRSDF